MKYSSISVVLAAIALVACQKNELDVKVSETHYIEFTSEKPMLAEDTKTAWTGSTIQWSKGDAIKVAYTCDDVWQNAAGTSTAAEASGSKTARAYRSTPLSADATTAKFSVPGDFTFNGEKTYRFYGVYPASAACEGPDFSYAPALSVMVPACQTPAADSFDPSADILIGKATSEITGAPTEPVSISWDRMVAHAQITFKTINGFVSGESIQSIVLTANSDADMVGAHYIALDDETVTKAGNNAKANVLTINGDNLSVDADGNVTAWAAFLPCTVTSLNVVVTTDKATYTREISSCSLAFKKNARNALAINMASASRVVNGTSTATLKDFAKAFVSYLDVWESTVGGVSADGTHCADNGTEWENVHFVPVPMDMDNGWTNHGSQYDAQYKPYHTITVGGTTYDASQCWEIAIRGLLNLCTSEGEAFLTGMTTRNDAYTLANGAKLSDATIPSYTSTNKWGKYPWYEADNTVKYNGAAIETVDVNFLIKVGGFHIVRGLIKNTANSSPLGYVGNYQEFGTKSSTLILDGYVGYICPMREFLIAARIYKYLLDNNIDENVYDAIKDVKFDFDLYNQGK